MTTKTFARRDSATALLRKMGIDKAKYGKFITEADGKFTVDVKAAEKSLKKPAAKAKKPTVSSVAREAILKGKANDAVFKLLQEQFKLDDSKKHYPAWYRSELRRKGLIAN